MATQEEIHSKGFAMFDNSYQAEQQYKRVKSWQS